MLDVVPNLHSSSWNPVIICEKKVLLCAKKKENADSRGEVPGPKRSFWVP